MKKLMVVLLAIVMVVSMVACGEKAPTPTNAPDATNAPLETQANPTEVVAGEKLELTLWSLNYDADVWTYEEDNVYDYEDYSNATIIIPNGEDSYEVNVEITVEKASPESFRDYLNSYGFDAYEYAVNNAYELTDIGGIKCLTEEGNYWGDPCLRYIGRDEAASMTVLIEIIGEYEDARVTSLINGLTINVKDIGNVDGPWSWEGEAFSAENASAMTGTYKIDSQWLPITECIITDETFDHAVAVVGDKAYILGDGVLRQYAYDGTSLVYESNIIDEGDFGNIQATADGSVWVSGFMEPLLNYKDGVKNASYDDMDEVTMHPSGEWGINWFSSPECEKITFAGGAVSKSPINFPEVSTISTLVVDDNYIYVCGSAADESGHKVYVYNTDGALQMTLTDAEGEGLGSITFITQTANGFLGMDGNMRDVVLWSTDGKFIGTIEDGDLFGTDYPWFCAGAKLADGSIIVVMTEDRADESAMELVAFKLTGF